MRDKIVVTGYGVKAPNTNNIGEYIYNLKNGVCCLDTVTDLSPNGETTIIGRINSGLDEFESDKRFKRLPRATLLGMASGKEALNQARLSNLADKKVGLFFGISVGAIGEKLFHDSIIHVNENNYRNVPLTFS
ncbi:beta-ketoacyl synthase N-terminal-like domain-containing protein, partial [Peribacillus loiseleuriae]|uniref:beta-ketoacyl synthase N-terminal-like domain-containing protein n=1 Tax=Peribacillus loiseleuriae TaxID=1679170 RepID=UPI00381C3595